MPSEIAFVVLALTMQTAPGSPGASGRPAPRSSSTTDATRMVPRRVRAHNPPSIIASLKTLLETGEPLIFE